MNGYEIIWVNIKVEFTMPLLLPALPIIEPVSADTLFKSAEIQFPPLLNEGTNISSL